MPLNVGTIRGLDCRTYGNLKNTLPIQSSPSTLPHRRMLVLKASINDGPMKKMGRSDAECEAAVVAGNIPEAPPVPATPSSPAGTPVVPSLVSSHLSFTIVKLMDLNLFKGSIYNCKMLLIIDDILHLYSVITNKIASYLLHYVSETTGFVGSYLIFSSCNNYKKLNLIMENARVHNLYFSFCEINW